MPNLQKIFAKTSTTKLRDKLDKIFSTYIRMRELNSSGYNKCFTCGRLMTFKESQAGHFHSRRHMSLRWDERNVQNQCYSCNINDQGAGPKFAQALKRKYGDGILDILEIKRNNVCRMGKFEYAILIEEFEGKISQLASRDQA